MNNAKEYKVISGGNNDFDHKLSTAISQGYKIHGNLTTVNIGQTPRHSILVYKN